MIEMPKQQSPVTSQAHGSKKPKLKLRRKGSPAEVPKKDVDQTKNPSSSPNGLRNEDEQTNRSDDLTGEDYEKLAKLLQV